MHLSQKIFHIQIIHILFKQLSKQEEKEDNNN